MSFTCLQSFITESMRVFQVSSLETQQFLTSVVLHSFQFDSAWCRYTTIHFTFLIRCLSFWQLCCDWHAFFQNCLLNKMKIVAKCIKGNSDEQTSGKVIKCLTRLEQALSTFSQTCWAIPFKHAEKLFKSLERMKFKSHFSLKVSINLFVKEWRFEAWRETAGKYKTIFEKFIDSPAPPSPFYVSRSQAS